MKEKNMSQKNKLDESVQVMITLPRRYRDLLRLIAAEKNMENPDKVHNASKLGREFLCAAVDNYLNLIEGGNTK